MSTHAYTTDLLKEIKVETNDPHAPLITLTMKAKVYESLKVFPRIVNLGRMQKGQSATREVTLENAGKKPFRITKITPTIITPSVLSVAPSEPFTLKPGETRRLVVRVDTMTAMGFVDGNVTLETDLPNLPKKTVYVHLEVRDKPNGTQ